MLLSDCGACAAIFKRERKKLKSSMSQQSEAFGSHPTPVSKALDLPNIKTSIQTLPLLVVITLIKLKWWNFQL